MAWSASSNLRDRPVPGGRGSPQSLARISLAAFVFTFIAARLTVLLIMARRMPDLFLHAGGTHVHHLDYGIILLSLLAGILLFHPPAGRARSVAAALYGIGLGLTFDEFGMWLHLGGSYWQRASFDAVVVVAALLGLVAAASSIRRFRPRHWVTAVALAVCLLLFAAAMMQSLGYAGRAFGPRLERLEESGPQ